MRDPEGVRQWLRAAERANYLEQTVMTLHFDLEGATNAHQYGLAWLTANRVLRVALQIYVLERGQSLPEEHEAGRTPAVIAEIAKWNSDVSDGAYQLLLAPVSLTLTDLRQHVGAVSSFLTALGFGRLSSRRAATRSWIESVEMLRATAKTIGLASEDGWYISDSNGELDWHDQAIQTLGLSNSLDGETVD